ncbi:MAG: hypothetical protein JOZ15_09890, partial [Acidobacteria bacterium]|nr:hypothetical protein [Acidobacteriota bacterium]
MRFSELIAGIAAGPGVSPRREPFDRAAVADPQDCGKAVAVDPQDRFDAVDSQDRSDAVDPQDRFDAVDPQDRFDAV